MAKSNKERKMEEKLKKQALRMFSYGVYVITSENEGVFCASIVTWVSQASFNPPMISVCLKKGGNSYEVVKQKGEFILHLLGENQKEMAGSFFKPINFEDGKINGHDFKFENKIPLLENIPAYLQCRVMDILENGDHPLFLAEVTDAVVHKDVNPLELRKTGWTYGG